MSDLGRYLPLSNRPRADESAVTADRRAQIAGIVDAAARLIADAPAEDAPALTSAFLATAGLEADAATGGRAEGTALAAAAQRVRTGPRRGARHLVRAARAYLVLAHETDAAAHLDAAITGAVALAASTTAPFARRAAIAGHTVRADDDGWQFGRGPLLTGSGVQIASFLLGVTDEPPRRATGVAPGTLEG